MTTVADVVDAVAGVDTHADTLAVAIAAPSGVVVAEAEFAATGAGIEDLIGWVVERAPRGCCSRLRGPAATGSAWLAPLPASGYP